LIINQIPVRKFQPEIVQVIEDYRVKLSIITR